MFRTLSLNLPVWPGRGIKIKEWLSLEFGVGLIFNMGEVRC